MSDEFNAALDVFTKRMPIHITTRQDHLKHRTVCTKPPKLPAAC